MVRRALRRLFRWGMWSCDVLHLSRRGLAGYFPLRQLYALAFSQLKDPQRSVKLGGYWLRLDPQDSLELSVRASYEPFQTRLLLDTLRPGDVFADVGAFIGYYTVLAAARVGPKGLVVAFEPDPDTFALLRTNVHDNGLSNVRLFSQALSDSEGLAWLYRAPRTSDNQLSGKPGSGLQVVTTTLDRFFGRGERLDVLKLDAEGSEARIFLGMRSTLQTHPQLIVFTEFYPRRLKESGVDAASYLRMITESNFLIYEISEARRRLIPVTNPNILLQRYNVRNGRLTNLVLVPRMSVCVRTNKPFRK